MQRDAIIRLVIPTIESFNHFQHKPYIAEDGSWRYGFGFDKDDLGDAVSQRTPALTRAEALVSLKKRLSDIYESIFPRLIGKATQGQMAAILGFAYDLGMKKLSETPIISFIEIGNLEAARQELLRGVYIKKNNKLLVSKQREARRKAEAMLWSRPDVQ